MTIQYTLVPYHLSISNLIFCLFIGSPFRDVSERVCLLVSREHDDYVGVNRQGGTHEQEDFVDFVSKYFHYQLPCSAWP